MGSLQNSTRNPICSRSALDKSEWFVRCARKLQHDQIARLDNAASHDNAHDACLAGDVAHILRLHLRPQTLLESVYINAGLSESCDFNYRIGTQMQSRARRQTKQIDSMRRNVFAEFAWRDDESIGTQRIEQLGLNQVHLTKIGCTRRSSFVVAMLHRRAAMRIAFDAQALEQMNARLGPFAEVVSVIQMNRHHSGVGVGDDGGDASSCWHGPIFARHESPTCFQLSSSRLAGLVHPVINLGPTHARTS